MSYLNAVRYESPLGVLTLVSDGSALTALQFPGRFAVQPQGDPRLLAAAVAELDEYFKGERQAFSLAIDLKGTTFQQRIWAALREIPYGDTTTYGALARKLEAETGEPHEPRAVGAAIGRTPTPIVVPCHRVIGADGSLTGYGGGLDRKRALLGLEASGGNPAALSPDWGAQLALV